MVKKQKYYYVYCITNKINGKKYMGAHETYNINDGYMGSGTLIKQAIRKYGVENFNKEIVSWCNSREAMYYAERAEIDLNEPEYNLAAGGHGGFAYINSNGLAMSKEHQVIANKVRLEKLKDPVYNAWFSTRVRSGFSEAWFEANAKHLNNIRYDWTGRKHSTETRLRMSQNAKRLVGEKNPSFGSAWLNNPVSRESRRFLRDEISTALLSGWIRGRKQSWE